MSWFSKLRVRHWQLKRTSHNPTYRSGNIPLRDLRCYFWANKEESLDYLATVSSVMVLMASANASGASSFMIQSAMWPVYLGIAISPVVSSWNDHNIDIWVFDLHTTYYSLSSYYPWFKSYCDCMETPQSRKYGAVLRTIRRKNNKSENDSKAPGIRLHVSHQSLQRGPRIRSGLHRRRPRQPRGDISTPVEPGHRRHNIALEHLQNNEWVFQQKIHQNVLSRE